MAIVGGSVRNSKGFKALWRGEGVSTYGLIQNSLLRRRGDSRVYP